LLQALSLVPIAVPPWLTWRCSGLVRYPSTLLSNAYLSLRLTRVRM